MSHPRHQQQFHLKVIDARKGGMGKVLADTQLPGQSTFDERVRREIQNALLDEASVSETTTTTIVIQSSRQGTFGF